MIGERLEAAFEYTIDHPESLLIISGVFLALISVFTVTFDSGTTGFLRVLAIGLVVRGVLLYVLRLGLRFVLRVVRRLFSL